MNNILVTGSKGQLGSSLKKLASKASFNNFFFTDINNLDITDYTSIINFIEINKITVIINCAAYTNVDKAEFDLKLADSINNLAVKKLAQIAKSYKIKLIHISTDYVFDGNNSKPYIETDNTNPQTVYGQTKLSGESAIKEINPAKSIIIRTSWLYSKFGKNFVKTMLRLAKNNKKINVVFDQIGSPTNAHDLAKIILNILPKIKNENVEIFHYSNNGCCSWYEFADAIFKINNLRVEMNPVKSEHYKTDAKRPLYSVMCNDKIKSLYKISIPSWEESLFNHFRFN